MFVKLRYICINYTIEPSKGLFTNDFNPIFWLSPPSLFSIPLYIKLYKASIFAPSIPLPHPTLLVDVICEWFQSEMLRGGGRVEYGQLKATSILEGKTYISLFTYKSVIVLID